MALQYHRLDKITLPGSIEFDQLSNVRVTGDIEQLLARPAGHPHPMFTANRRTRPTIRFTTTQLDVVLNNIGSGGTAFTSASHLYFKAISESGLPSRAATDHRRYQAAQLLAYWTNIRLPHNDAGTADVILQLSYDGSNDPLVMQSGVALSGNATAGTFFGAGPALINGTALEAGSVQQIDIASGITLDQRGGNSEEFDRFVGVKETGPTITIQTSEAIAFFTYGLQGTALDGASGVVVYGRKFSNTGSRVANGTAQHISLQGLNGIVRPVESGADGSELVDDQIRCDLIAGSDDVLPLLQLPNVVSPS